MAIETHVDRLIQKHSALERVIEDETRRPLPNSMELTKLKREKLRLKEEIGRIGH